MARKLSRRSILNRIKIRIPPAIKMSKFATGNRLIAYLALVGSKTDNVVEWDAGDTIQWSISDNLEW